MAYVDCRFCLPAETLLDGVRTALQIAAQRLLRKPAAGGEIFWNKRVVLEGKTVENSCTKYIFFFSPGGANEDPKLARSSSERRQRVHTPVDKGA